MRLHFLVLIFIAMACSKKVVSQNTYSLQSEALEISKENFKSSDISFDIDFNTGVFTGTYKGKSYSGQYEITNTASGFVKGFFYRVKLISLKKEAPASVNEELFFEKIIKTSRIGIQPDNLQNPNLMRLELNNSIEKLTFVKIL